MDKKKVKKAAISSAAAVVAAAGIAAGGCADTPAELILGEDSASPHIEYSIASGSAEHDAPDTDSADEITDTEDEERRISSRSVIKRAVYSLPLAVRVLVVLPLWAIGSVLTWLLGLAGSALSPYLGHILITAGLVIAAGAVIWGAVKSVFPDARLRDVFTKRNITIAVSAAVVISALDWILAACLEGYDSIKFYIITALLFVFSACFTLAFALSAARKNAAEEAPAPIPEEPVDPVITITDSAGTFTLHPEK